MAPTAPARASRCVAAELHVVQEVEDEPTRGRAQSFDALVSLLSPVDVAVAVPPRVSSHHAQSPRVVLKASTDLPVRIPRWVQGRSYALAGRLTLLTNR